jgi:hypothetical protein
MAGTLADWGTAGLLLVGATECSATADRLKTVKLFEGRVLASAQCECFQNGQ